MTRSASRTPAQVGGQVCALFAADIAEFTRPDRDDDVRRFMHEELYRILEQAFDGSGIPWSACFREDRGDGALVVVPPGIAAKGIIDPMPERLHSLIRRHNHVSSAAAHIQLRVAAHLGPVDHDGHGFVGSDVDFLFRMLDCSAPQAHARRGPSRTGTDCLRLRLLQYRLPPPQPGQSGRLPVRQVQGQIHKSPGMDLCPQRTTSSAVTGPYMVGYKRPKMIMATYVLPGQIGAPGRIRTRDPLLRRQLLCPAELRALET